MAAKINESLTYPGADVEAVYAVITDQAFRVESAEHQKSSDITVTVEPDGDGATVTIVRTQEAAMPDFIKKVTGPTVKVKQTEKWHGPAADGSRTADIKVSIIGQPAETTGTAKLSPGSDGTLFDVKAEVKVNIPFIGKKFEPEVAKAIVASLREEVEYGTAQRL